MSAVQRTAAGLAPRGLPSCQLRLRGVIFDMDGVLVDSHAVHRKTWRLFLRSLGREVPDSDLDFILDGRKRGEILRHFLGDLSDEEAGEYGRRKDIIFRRMQLEVTPVPGVLELIRSLDRAGVALALATSASRSRALSTLARLGLEDLFRVVVTGEDVASGKPDPAVYRMACARLGIAPEELLAVEDAIAGVRAAVGAGLRCLAVALHEEPEKLTAAGAVYVMKDFRAVSAQGLEEILLKDDRLGRSREGTAARGTNVSSGEAKR